MKKSLRKLALNRETLRRLNPADLRAAGADNQPPWTIKLPPTNGYNTCECGATSLCYTYNTCFTCDP